MRRAKAKQIGPAERAMNGRKNFLYYLA